MILSNENLYTNLFIEISNSCGVEISTFSDYFTNLNIIQAFVSENPQYGYFLKLPIDEDMISIDANTRKIIIPKNFQIYGVSMVEDNRAETLWFSIDRYYDIQDFKGTDTAIIIKWRLPSGEEGYTIPNFIHLSTEQNKIYFEWTLSNWFTMENGTIEFSVVFDGANHYHFHTLPAQLAIKSNLLKYNDTQLYQNDSYSLVRLLERLETAPRTFNLRRRLTGSAEQEIVLPSIEVTSTMVKINSILSLQIQNINDNSSTYAYRWEYSSTGNHWDIIPKAVTISEQGLVTTTFSKIGYYRLIIATKNGTNPTEIIGPTIVVWS